MPHSDKERIQLEFLGETFTIKGSANRTEIQKTSDYLNEQMDLIRTHYPSLTAKGVAVLTAFQLANELLQVRLDYEDLVSLLDKP